jgi:hypothetical protein
MITLPWKFLPSAIKRKIAPGTLRHHAHISGGVLLCFLVASNSGVGNATDRETAAQERPTNHVREDGDGWNSPLGISVDASPPTFKRVGQTINLVYSIKNNAQHVLQSALSVTDSETIVACGPKDKKVKLAPGDTLQCRASLTVAAEHFVAGELRHNFIVVSDGDLSRLQEAVVCRAGWEGACADNTQLMCDLHNEMQTTSTRPELCDARPGPDTADDQGSEPCASANAHDGCGKTPDFSENSNKKALSVSGNFNGNREAANLKQVIVNLRPDAFVPNAAMLLPRWKLKLDVVAKIVTKDKSLLKIVLHSVADPISLSKARTTAVKHALLAILEKNGKHGWPDIDLVVVGRLTD